MKNLKLLSWLVLAFVMGFLIAYIVLPRIVGATANYCHPTGNPNVFTVSSVNSAGAFLYEGTCPNGPGKILCQSLWCYNHKPVLDLCNNVDGIQIEVPEHYYQDKDSCYPQTAVCTDKNAVNYDRDVEKDEYEDNSVCIAKVEKSATVIGNCDGSAVVTVFAGNTRRTWRVDEGDKFWLDYYESKEVKGTIDSVIEWWHNGEWQLFDPTLTYRTPATGCSVPTPEEPKRGMTEASAPQCTDLTPVVLPSNVHVIRSGADATVNFFTSSNNANIYFKEVSSPVWQHAARDISVTGGYVSYTIHDLNPALGYTFGIEAANSCAGSGKTVLAVVVDGPQTVTFPLSYWEWL